MAASTVRVRLSLKSVSNNCALTWLLVDKRFVKTINDLDYFIRQRFGVKVAKNGSLNMCVQDALLPPAESVDILRDNDILSVTLSSSSTDSPSNLPQNCFSNGILTNGFNHSNTELPHELDHSTAGVIKEKSHKKKKAKRNSEDNDSERYPSKNVPNNGYYTQSSMETTVSHSTVKHKNKKKRKHESIEPEIVDRKLSKTSEEIEESPKKKHKRDAVNNVDGKRKKSRASIAKDASILEDASNGLFSQEHSSSNEELQTSKKSKSKRKEKRDVLNNEEQCTNPVLNNEQQQQSCTLEVLSNDKMSADLEQAEIKQKRKRKRKRNSLKKMAPSPGSQLVTPKAQNPVRFRPPNVRPCNNRVVFNSDVEEDNNGGDNDAAVNCYKAQPYNYSVSEQAQIPKSCNIVNRNSEKDLTSRLRELSQSSGGYNGLTGKELNAENGLTGNNEEDGCQVYNRRQRRRGLHQQYSRSKEDQLRDIATNVSVILQNTSTSSGGGGVCGGTQETSDVAAEPPAAPQRDYSQYGGLLGPPRPGDVIAYKVLEMTENYCPEISEYKEAKVISFDHVTEAVVMQLTGPRNKKMPGRFDLSIEYDEEILTNTTESVDNVVSLQWKSLIEPKIIID